ncbi:MAG TPA: hypothetical protein VN083_00820, partial [Vicinamibacteria bacterium]|nr:hypothetical protein [Vicinamibacteria bacterium]
MAERTRGGRSLALWLTPFVALLPFLRGLLLGRAFYFRDLSAYFFPLRRFVVEGLARGELRYWNPFAQGMGPVTLPP